MAQHDYIIANQSGAAFRSDLNNGLAAIVSQNSGAAQPSTTYAYQWWADTTTGLLKLRNAANNAWITVGTLADANLGLLALGGGTLTGALLLDDSGTVSAPALAFDGDANTGIWRSAADTLNVATNGVENAEFGTSEVVFNDGGADIDFRIEGDTKPNLFKIDAGLDEVQVANLNGGPLAGFRNRIINGDMRIDQRNAGAAQSLAPGIKYTVDRWLVNATGGTVTGQKVTGASANQFRYQITGAVGVTNVVFAQRIEAANSADLAEKTVTLSVDLSNSVLTTVNWQLQYANATNDFSGVTSIATGSWTVSNSVNRYSTQISIPAAATTGLQVVVSVGSQTSGTWTIGDVQLEPGSVATPFERRPIGTELALCQRYYCETRVHAQSPVAGALTVPVHFPVTMRATPTSTLVSAGSSSGADSPVITASSSLSARFQINATLNGGFIVERQIAFSAEL